MKRLLWCSALMLSLGLFGCGGGDDTETDGGGGGNTNTTDGGGGGEQQAANDLDLTYVLPEFQIAVVAHPQRVWSSQLAQGVVEKDTIADRFLEQSGLDPRKIERVLVLGKVPPPEVMTPRTRQGGVGDEFPEGFERDLEQGESEEAFEADEASEEEGEAASEESAPFSEEEFGEEEEGPGFGPGEGGNFGGARLEPPPRPEMPALVVWYSEPIDTAAVLEKAPVDADEPLSHANTKIYQSRWSPETEPSVAFPTEKTMLFGRVAVLKKLIDANGPSSGALAERLSKESLDADLVMVSLLADHEDSVKAFADVMGGDLPEDAATALDLSTAVDAVVARIDLGAESLIDVVLETESAEVAGQLAAKGKEGVKALQQLVGVFKSFAGQDQDALAIFGLAESTLAGVSIERSETTVHGKVAAPSDWSPVVALVNDAVEQAKGAAKAASAKRDFKEIGVAFHNFHDAYGGFPSVAAFQDAEGKPLLSWRVALLPYLEESALFEEIALDEAWDSEQNKALLERMPAIFKSPGVDEPGMTTVVAVVGDTTGLGPLPKGAPFRPGNPKTNIKFRDLTDGSSNTILVIRTTPENAVPWTKPADLPFDEEKLDQLVVDSSDGAFMAIFADGSVNKLDAKIPAEVLRELLIRNDGEIPRYDEYVK